MFMITGIIAALLWIIVCLRAVEAGKKRGLFTKIHRPASIALLAISVLHVILAVLFLGTRPIFVLLTGAFFTLSIAAALFGEHKAVLRRVSTGCACVFLISHFVFYFIAVDQYENQVRNIVIHNADISNIPDGVYTGECDVTLIYTKVAVTVQSGRITDIAILEHVNERGRPAERIVDDILARQTIDVDAVSGATNSSSAIKKAVENALALSVGSEDAVSGATS